MTCTEYDFIEEIKNAEMLLLEQETLDILNIERINLLVEVDFIKSSIPLSDKSLKFFNFIYFYLKYQISLLFKIDSKKEILHLVNETFNNLEYFHLIKRNYIINDCSEDIMLERRFVKQDSCLHISKFVVNFTIPRYVNLAHKYVDLEFENQIDLRIKTMSFPFPVDWSVWKNTDLFGKL